MIYLEIASVNDHTQRSLYGQPHGVGNGVADAEELDLEAAHPEPDVWLDHV